MSNIAITPGSGVSSVATETISGVDYQKIKLIDGRASSVTGLIVNTDGSLNASVIGTPTVSLAGGSVLAVQSGTVITSIAGTVTTAQSGTVITSISGTITTAQSGTVSTSIAGTVTTAQSGTVITSIAGTVPVTVTGSVLTYHAPNASLVSGVTSVITGTASVLVLAAAPGAQRNYITQITATNGSATGTFVNIVDNGGVIYSGYAAASGGGFALSFNPPLKQPTSVLALYVATTAQASVVAAVSGYTAA